MAYIEKKKKKTKYIQKKKKKEIDKLLEKLNEAGQHIKPIDKGDLGEDSLPKRKIPKIGEPREPLPTPEPKSLKPLKGGGRAKHNIGGLVIKGKPKLAKKGWK